MLVCLWSLPQNQKVSKFIHQLVSIKDLIVQFVVYTYIYWQPYSSPFCFQSGCCKPPIQCGYKYKNATFWMVPKSGPAAKDTDCTSWSNNQDKLCYNCNSCKAGVVDMSRMIWRIFTVLDTIDIAITVIIFALSCCIRKKILSDKKYTRVHPWSGHI